MFSGHWAGFLDMENTHLVVERSILQQALRFFLFLLNSANQATSFFRQPRSFVQLTQKGSFIIDLGFKSRTRTSNPNSVVTSGGVYIHPRQFRQPIHYSSFHLIYDQAICSVILRDNHRCFFLLVFSLLLFFCILTLMFLSLRSQLCNPFFLSFSLRYISFQSTPCSLNIITS